jgi:hypothetical protein
MPPTTTAIIPPLWQQQERLAQSSAIRVSTLQKSSHLSQAKTLLEYEKDIEPTPEPRVIGPLEQQRCALLSKLIFLERENLTIAVQPNEYKEM